MSDIASTQTYLYQPDANFRSGVSKNFMGAAGSTLNFLLDETNNNWLLCSSSGTFTTANSSFDPVTNQSGNLTVIASRPIIAGVIPDGSSNAMNLIGGGTGTDLAIEIKLNGSLVDQFNILTAVSQLGVAWFTLAAGTYAFRLLCAADGDVASVQGSAQYLRMFVRQW